MQDSPLRIRARTTAAPAAVHAALTTAPALETWLAEHADVDPDRGVFSFWGRYTPDGDEPHQRLLHADDRSLRFEWRLHGVTTTVDIGLSEEDGGTVIAVEQTGVPDHADAVANNTPLAILGTFWSLAVANLVDHLEGRPTTPKCDFTATTGFRAEVTVGAAPEQVYASLMDPARFRKWFLTNISVEPRVGGRWAMGDDFTDENSVAHIIDLDPNRRISLDWGGLVTTWELEGSAGRTRLTFVNSGFDQDNPPFADWTGWLSGVAALRRYHELPGYTPIWLSVDWPGMGDGVLVEELS